MRDFMFGVRLVVGIDGRGGCEGQEGEDGKESCGFHC